MEDEDDDLLNSPGEQHEETHADEGQGNANAAQEGGEGQEGQESEVAPAPRGHSANDRIRELVAERNAERAEREELRRQIEDLRRQQAQSNPQVDAWQREQERIRFEAMSPDERMDYRFQQFQGQQARQQEQLQRQLWASQDQAAFASLVAKDERVAKRADRVEQMFQEKLRTGQPVDRLTIAKFLIGEDVLKAKASKGARGGAQRVSQQTTRPGNGRGDVGTSGRSEGKSARERLEEFEANGGTW